MKVYATALKQLVFFLSLSWTSLCAQESPEVSLHWADTTLYLDQSTYTGFGYTGAEPLLIKMWFPKSGATSSQKSTLGEMLVPELEPVLNELEGPLRQALHSKMVEEYLSIDCNGNPLPGYHLGVLEEVLGFSTDFVPAPFLKSTTMPVVVYHHGAQGFPEENLELIRHLCATGFVVLGANFNLPYPNLPFGSKPWQGAEPPDPTLGLAALLNFARSLTSNKVLVVGHSWGAQNGWQLLPGSNLADAFVSLETTLEFKDDSLEVRRFWPDLYHQLTKDTTTLKIPVLAVAGTEKDEEFPWFGKKAPFLLCASSTSRFDHNAFLSAYFYRVSIGGNGEQDHECLSAQMEIYQELNALIQEFLFVFAFEDEVLENAGSKVHFYFN